MIGQLRQALYESIKEQLLKEVYEDVLRDLTLEAKNGKLQVSLKDIKIQPKQKPRNVNKSKMDGMVESGSEVILESGIENLTLQELETLGISRPNPSEREPKRSKIIDSLEYADILE